MHRIDGAGATVDNKFTDGDPVGGVQATVVTAAWLNDFQENIMAVLAAAGVSPTKGRAADLLDAIRTYSGGGIVGGARNAKMSIAAASATATFTADELIVETALAGKTYRLSNVNKTINLATTGVGGMDVGTAPVSGAVGVYVIYNPDLPLSSTNPALIAQNASSARVPEVHGAVNMPAGYTASALVAVLQTNASSQFPILFMEDRHVTIVPTQILNTTTAAASFTSLTMASVPYNAISVDITWQMTSGGSSTLNFATAASAASLNAIGPNMSLTSAALTGSGGYATQPLVTPKTTYYTFAAAGGATLAVYNIGYRF